MSKILDKKIVGLLMLVLVKVIAVTGCLIHQKKK